jgi:phosphinothricin acetyltransferase
MSTHEDRPPEPARPATRDGVQVRQAERADLPRLTEIYNHFVVHTPVTFDIEPYTVEKRAAWFEQFAPAGRHRLVVAVDSGRVLGYAGSMRFRPKPAYDTTVETTIYCAPEAAGRGVGSRLYAALFAALANEDVHTVVAGYTLPNAASEALHRRFAFRPVGVFTAVGRKFGRYWDVAWNERPLRLPAPARPDP